MVLRKEGGSITVTEMNTRSLIVTISIAALAAIGSGFAVYQITRDNGYDRGYAAGLNASRQPVQPTPEIDQHLALNFDNILLRINEERMKVNVPTLAVEQTLNRIAERDTTAECPDITHNSFQKEIRKGSLSKYSRFSENVATGVTTAKQTVDGWLDSPTHRQTMLDGGYVFIGIGIKDHCISTVYAK